jgi:uncharacterized membrane protein/mono/diheme cytochrome c family protein
VNQPVPLALLGRVHPAVLHFPIALLVAALVVELLLRKRPAEARRPVVTTLLVLAAGASVVTVASGLAFEGAEAHHGAAARILERHQWLGIGVAVVSVLALVAHQGALKNAMFRKAVLPLLLVASAGVAYTGHLGGTLVYGADFWTSALHGKESKSKDGDERVVATDGDDGVAGAATARQRWPEGPLPTGKVDYARDIKPIFERSCVKCHGAEKRKAGLRLDHKRFAMKGGETGAVAIIPGDPAKSLVYKFAALNADDEDIMPSKGKLLSLSELEIVKRWIAEGAEWPDEEPAK